MTIDELLLWRHQHNYPHLVLSSREGDILQHGAQSWKRLVQSDDMARTRRAMSRVERWREIEQQSSKGA